MELSLRKEELQDYVIRQVNAFFPDNHIIKASEIGKILDNALQRTEYNFSHINLKYYTEGNITFFNHLHSEQYCMFLWFLSNEAYRSNNINLAEKLFYLNKALNGLDAFYSINLPDIFILVHPVGTVIGNAQYNNYLTIYQNATIGASLDGYYPILDEGVSLFAGANVIGNSHISNNVSLSVNASVVNQNIPENTLVFGEGKNLILKHTDKIISNYTFKRF